MGQNWVPEWKDGHKDKTKWQQVAEALDISDDDTIINDMVSDIASKLAEIVLRNAPIDAMSDRTRRNQLNAFGTGKQIGLGRVFDENACLADSLLQALAAKSILPKELLHDYSPSMIQRRRLACSFARQNLIHHADYRLHPRWRDGDGVEVTDDGVDHDNAYLEHEVHSEALVVFFLEYLQS